MRDDERAAGQHGQHDNLEGKPDQNQRTNRRGAPESDQVLSSFLSGTA